MPYMIWAWNQIDTDGLGLGPFGASQFRNILCYQGDPGVITSQACCWPPSRRNIGVFDESPKIHLKSWVFLLNLLQILVKYVPHCMKSDVRHFLESCWIVFLGKLLETTSSPVLLLTAWSGASIRWREKATEQVFTREDPTTTVKCMYIYRYT